MPVDFEAIPSGVGIPDEAEQVRLTAKVAEVSASFSGNLTSIHEAIAKADKKYTEEALADFAPAREPGDQGVSPRDWGILEEGARKAAARKLDSFRSLVVEETRRNREDMLSQLEQAHARLELAAKATPTPVAMLGMTGLGDERRQRYEAQLYSAGPATLGNAAVLAITTNNLVLGAAILSRLDAIPVKERPISPQNLAERLVGERHRQMMERVERARIAVKAAKDADQILRTGRSTSFAKISQGLAIRALERAAGKGEKGGD
jgi:hypothetical protein